MLKGGIYYWKYSLENHEEFPDIYYTNDVIIIEPVDNNKDFLKKVNELRDLITSYCCLTENKIKADVDKVVNKIKDILTSKSNINYTEFVAYWKCLDVDYETFLEIPNQENILKKLLDKYCERRRKLYEKCGYTNVSIQALYDSGSSRTKGQKFKQKIKKIVVESLGEDVKLAFIGKNNWENIKQRLNLTYTFGIRHQDKIPDFFIEYKNHYIIGEAKHIHSIGGAQDKQISELIDFINQKESKANIHYLSLLDGFYMYHFNQDRLSDNKPNKQKDDIETALNKNIQNFFVNAKGLQKMLQDLKNGD